MSVERPEVFLLPSGVFLNGLRASSRRWFKLFRIFLEMRSSRSDRECLWPMSAKTVCIGSQSPCRRLIVGIWRRVYLISHWPRRNECRRPRTYVRAMIVKRRPSLDSVFIQRGRVCWTIVNTEWYQGKIWYSDEGYEGKTPELPLKSVIVSELLGNRTLTLTWLSPTSSP